MQNGILSAKIIKVPSVYELLNLLEILIWNQELSGVNQNFITAKINSSWKEKFNAQYKFDYLENTGLYKGLRNQVDANYKTEKDEIVAQANILSTKATLQNTNFARYMVDGKRKIGNKFWVGARVSGENNDMDDLDKNEKSDLSF